MTSIATPAEKTVSVEKTETVKKTLVVSPAGIKLLEKLYDTGCNFILISDGKESGYTTDYTNDKAPIFLRICVKDDNSNDFQKTTIDQLRALFLLCQSDDDDYMLFRVDNIIKFTDTYKLRTAGIIFNETLLGINFKNGTIKDITLCDKDRCHGYVATCVSCLGDIPALTEQNGNGGFLFTIDGITFPICNNIACLRVIGLEYVECCHNNRTEIVKEIPRREADWIHFLHYTPPEPDSSLAIEEYNDLPCICELNRRALIYHAELQGNDS